MRKNRKIHLIIDSDLWATLNKEAENKCVSLAELYRQKLRQPSQLNRIEFLLENISKQLTEK